MDPVDDENEHLYPTLHPLKLFDAAKSQGRYLYACAPMVRYSKVGEHFLCHVFISQYSTDTAAGPVLLAFRQTVHHYGTDLCWTPMILAKEFNRSVFAREGDLSISTREGGPRARVPTVVQFGACSPVELSRASSLAAPYVSGVDLNCGCPQSWACAESLGAALMDRRELVRDMVVETRTRLARDGWAVGLTDDDIESARGRSVTVKIRVHKDLRKTMDFIDTVLADDGACGWKRNIDWLTIHPRTRKTLSSLPINLEALEILTEKYGGRVPILVSGDIPQPPLQPRRLTPGPLHLPNLAGLMSARALLANPALFAGHETCPWEAVDVFLANLARAPLILKSSVHHLTEMLGPGYGPDKRALIGKRDRMRLVKCGNWIDVLDLLEELRAKAAAATPEEKLVNNTR
ncbi:dihydrouridine synthase [Apiospora saccharicola]